MDEIAYGRGHPYLTLIYQIEAGCVRLLWVGEERTEESFEKFFTLIGKELGEKIEFVCSDMWKPYLKLIAKHCTNALNILDRFHVVAKMNLAVDEVRAGETRRLVQDGYEPVSYTHLRAHETVLDIVCRLLLEKKNNYKTYGAVVNNTGNNTKMD